MLWSSFEAQFERAFTCEKTHQQLHPLHYSRASSPNNRGRQTANMRQFHFESWVILFFFLSLFDVFGYHEACQSYTRDTMGKRGMKRNSRPCKQWLLRLFVSSTVRFWKKKPESVSGSSVHGRTGKRPRCILCTAPPWAALSPKTRNRGQSIPFVCSRIVQVACKNRRKSVRKRNTEGKSMIC